MANVSVSRNVGKHRSEVAPIPDSIVDRVPRNLFSTFHQQDRPERVEPFVRNFIRMSLIWFSVGLLIGFSMVFWPSHIVYRPAHVHALLLGFVSMMIFGVSYHVLPRFTGRPLHNRSLAQAHFWSANVGLVLLVGGFILRVHFPGAGSGVLGVGALISTAAGGLFVYNAWRTLGPAPSKTGAPIQLKGRIQ